MISKTVKAILGAALVGFICVSHVIAQDPPNAEVDDQGRLVLDPGGPNEQTIEVPDGTVDGNGDLVIGSTTITKPTATVLEDGSLDLGDGTVLPVPEGPPTGESAFITWMNVGSHETVPYGESAPDWHWSYTFKAVVYQEAWVTTAWVRELGAFVFFATESGTGSLDGCWAYAFDFPVAGSGGTWIWVDVTSFPVRMESGGSVMEGWLYLAGGSYAKWFRVKEFDDIAEPGTYLWAGEESYRLTTQP
jgi:hypothetical protein